MALALQLPPAERLLMIEQLAETFRRELATPHEKADELHLSPEEIAGFMRSEPLTPQEIVARGLLGTWSDMGIEDGAEWVNARKRQRRERRQWTMD